MRLFTLVLVAACTPASVDSSVESSASFCSTLDEVGTWEQSPIDSVSASSGVLWARLLTDQSDDPRDPFYVAYRAFALEPAETGGVQTTGNTSGDGILERTVGVGNWALQASWSRGSTTCLAEATLPVDPQMTTRACVLLTCPD